MTVIESESVMVVFMTVYVIMVMKLTMRRRLIVNMVVVVIVVMWSFNSIVESGIGDGRDGFGGGVGVIEDY